MFIVSLTYKVPLEKIDEELDNHIRFLKKQYALNNFHASGRKVPRTGGIILSLLNDKSKLEAILNEDPFSKKDLAKYDIIEFVPSMTSDELTSLLST